MRCGDEGPGCVPTERALKLCTTVLQTLLVHTLYSATLRPSSKPLRVAAGPTTSPEVHVFGLRAWIRCPTFLKTFTKKVRSLKVAIRGLGFRGLGFRVLVTNLIWGRGY